MPKSGFADLLKEYDDFSEGNFESPFRYELGAPGFSLLKEKYPIEEVAGKGTTQEKALSLLSWCHKNILHNGGAVDVEFLPKTSLDILDYSFGHGRERGVYCRLQAIVFTECCLALGLRSRILHCLPHSSSDFDSHVVSMVFLPEMKKWVLLDPGNDQYFLDEKGALLSPEEIRARLAKGERVKTHYPDDNFQTYMTKNLFYFKSLLVNTFGSDLLEHQKTIYCIPRNFPVMEREIAYSEFAIRNVPPHLAKDWVEANETFKKRKTILTMSAERFWK